MAALVLELQREALNKDASTTNLLRMALVVARKLGVSEFSEWVDAELNGYKEGVPIPDYRVLHGSLKVWNPYRGWQPLYMEDTDAAERLSTRPNNQAIPELESMFAPGKEHADFISYFSKDLEQRLMSGMEFSLQPAVLIGPAKVHGIIDAVRTAILDWSLKLEAAGVLGDEMTFSSDEKAKAPSSSDGITYQVQNQTVIHSMQQSQIQQGSTGSSQVFSHPSMDISNLDVLMDEIKSALETLDIGSSERAELNADLATIEAQQGSPKPRIPIIKEALRSIRAVLENAAGSGIGNAIPALLEKIQNMLL